MERRRTVAKYGLAFWMTVLIMSATSASASQYSIDWFTIDGGGGTSSGGSYTITGTIGQPDAGWGIGGSYELLGGFMPGGPLCFVQFDDFARFADSWLAADLTADLDDDNDIDFGDLQYLTDFWLLGCPYGWPLK